MGTLDQGSRHVVVAEEAILEENIDLINEEHLRTRVGFSLDRIFFVLWIFYQDQICNYVSQITVLVQLHLAQFVECAVFNAINQPKLREHARESFEITLTKVVTVAGAADVKAAEGEDDGEHSQGDTLAFSCFDLHEVVADAGLEGLGRVSEALRLLCIIFVELHEFIWVVAGTKDSHYAQNLSGVRLVEILTEVLIFAFFILNLQILFLLLLPQHVLGFLERPQAENEGKQIWKLLNVALQPLPLAQFEGFDSCDHLIRGMLYDHSVFKSSRSFFFDQILIAYVEFIEHPPQQILGLFLKVIFIIRRRLVSRRHELLIYGVQISCISSDHVTLL